MADDSAPALPDGCPGYLGERRGAKLVAVALVAALAAALGAVRGVWAAGGGAAAAPSPALLLTGARVLDESGDRLVAGRDVLVADGRIVAVGPAGSLRAPAAAGGSGEPVRVDLSGLALLPGLIDLHTHLLLHPYDESDLGRPGAQGAARAAHLACRARDHAGDAAGGLHHHPRSGHRRRGLSPTWRCKHAIEQGIIPGPRILA